MSPTRLAMRNHTTPASIQPPIAIVTIYAQQNPVTPTPSAHPVNRSMPSVMIVGLAMIPVVLFLVGLCMLLLYWSRKRKVVPNQYHTSRTPPPVPQKDSLSNKSSIASQRGSGKVFQMQAFSAPVERDGRREAQFAHPTAIQTMDANENKSRNRETPKLSLPVENQRNVDEDLDSPIDGTSPFRLKRGDTVKTVKRHSLGPALAKLWPSSPAEERWKAPVRDHILPPPVCQRKPPVYHLRPMPCQHGIPRR